MISSVVSSWVLASSATGSAWLVIALAVLGILVGPFLGVIVDRAVERLPLRLNHRCTSCQHPTSSTGLFPVVSWFQSCQSCGSKKGLRYVAVDLALAVVFALFGLRFGASAVLVPYLLLAAVLVALSAIDFETHLLPNIIVWPSIFAGLFLILVWSGEMKYGEGINSALLGAAIFGGFIGAAHLINEQGMGRGDVKLSVLLGLYVGWPESDLIMTTRLVFFTMILALMTVGIVGLAVNKIRRTRDEVPFGPALAGATIAMVVLSPALSSSSLS